MNIEALVCANISISVIAFILDVVFKRTVDHQFKSTESRIVQALEIERNKKTYSYQKEFEILREIYFSVFEHYKECRDFVLHMVNNNNYQISEESEKKMTESFKKMETLFSQNKPFLYSSILSTMEKFIEESDPGTLTTSSDIKENHLDETIRSIDDAISTRLNLK